MKASARAVIIGGGVVGASVLYHLARIGWTDVLLLEKSELTSGSTWHAAGGMHTFNGEANISRLQKYTIDLYREIEALSGQSCGLHPNGGLMLAATQGELDSLKLICSRARYLGMETEMITLAEALELQPADRPEAFHRRAVARGRRPLRPVRHDARVRQGGAIARRVGRALHTRVQSLAQRAGRQLGRRDRQGHRPRRARGQLRRPLGARDRPDGRHRAAGARDGAPLPADRGHPRAEGPGEGDRQHDRLRRRDLHAPGARRRADRHLRAARQGLVAGKHAGRFLDAAAARRIRPASRRTSRSASSISRRSAAPASARRSTARSRSRRTAIRWSARCAACATTGSPAR